MRHGGHLGLRGLLVAFVLLLSPLSLQADDSFGSLSIDNTASIPAAAVTSGAGTGFEQDATDEPILLQLDTTAEPEQITSEELTSVCSDGVSQIGFVSGVPTDVFVINADGSDRQPITSNRTPDSNISWSPNGSRLTLASQPSGNVQVWTMNADGTNARALTGGGGAYHPNWSPNGAFIVYVRYILGQGDIWVMNADGGNQRPLTTNDRDEQWPTWSPDSRRIAYVEAVGEGSAISVMNANGTNAQQLTTGDALNTLPQWSPDGARIAFASDRTGQSQIYVMNTDGTNVRNLSNNSAMEAPTGWSPDGRFIVFFSNRGSDDPRSFNIFVMTADGRNVRQVTRDTGQHNENAVWRPCSDTVVEDVVPLIPDCRVSPSRSVNVRNGPGTNFGVESSLAPNSTTRVIGRTTGTDGFLWWQLDSGWWVRSDVVAEIGLCNSVPVVPR